MIPTDALIVSTIHQLTINLPPVKVGNEIILPSTIVKNLGADASKADWKASRCDILWVLEVGTTHFYHLALFNLVLGLTSILLKSKKFKWWMAYMVTWPYMVLPPSWGDSKSIYRPVTISVQAIYISFSTALQVYKARFYNILWHELIACSRYVEFIAAILKFQMSTVNLKTWILSMLFCLNVKIL